MSSPEKTCAEGGCRLPEPIRTFDYERDRTMIWPRKCEVCGHFTPAIYLNGFRPAG